MKKRTLRKHPLFLSLLVSLLLILLFLWIHEKEFQTYTKEWNQKLESILLKLQEDYPNLSKNEIISILNEESNPNKSSLSIYGIDIEKDSYVLQNEKEFHKYTIVITSLWIGICICYYINIFYRQQKMKKKIQKITYYLEEINNGNYQLDIEENQKDELSILKNEIYKTTILLKEAAENSLNDKRKLKEALSDISHQLKTPLTSILISLDNILENPNMSLETRTEFIKAIKRETVNISFHIQTLLKLTRFDANTIQFHRQTTSMKEMIKEAIQNVALIAELKNIEIFHTSKEPIHILCDPKWQVEALTNILKNCIEHSDEQKTILITTSNNKIYSQLIIEDHGSGISPKDLPNIFKRFYKCKNSSKESIGIGLSLAKTIIEKDNGFIKVESKLGVGTKFIINYFKTKEKKS